MRYSEQQVTSELLDQPLFGGAPKKLFLCSTPRSGSYLLCRYMINAGLGVPHEYFNPVIIRQMAPRLGLGPAVEGLKWRPRNKMDRLPFGKTARASEEDFLRKYLALLVPRRCQNGIFAAKVHFEQLAKVLENPTGRNLLEGGVFVHLYRNDLLGQAVSTHFAKLTGRWSIDDTITTPPATNPNFFDFAAIDGLVQKLAEDDQGWRLFFARNGLTPLSFSYEEMCKDPFGFVVTIARRIGFEPAMLHRGYSESSDARPSEDAGLPSKREVVRRYVEACGTLRESVLRPSIVTAKNGEENLVKAGE